MRFLWLWEAIICRHPSGKRALLPTFNTVCQDCGAADERLGYGKLIIRRSA